MYETLYQGKDDIYYNHSRPEMLKFIPDGIKDVFDIGCGTGNFGYFLKEKLKLNVWGLEPDKTSASVAGKKLNHVINGIFDFDTANTINKKFDAIFFNDVLEHLVEPEQALENCRPLLKPSGVIIASIPNARFYTVLNDLIFNKDFRYQNSGLMDKTHLRFFTKASMIRMFEGVGLEIRTIEAINHEPVNGRKIKFLKFILFKYLTDIDVLQYAIVASFNKCHKV